MKIFSTTFGIFTLLAIFAQPVITDGSNLQPVGSSYLSATVSLSASDIGFSGANQTWDFSAYSINNLTYLSVVELSTTPFEVNFPTSNWTFQLGPYYSFFEVGTTEMNNLAFNINGSIGGNGDYSMNPKKIMEFPFNYQDVFVDTYEENGSSKSITVTYDGYGTLIMPDGYSYSNIIRVLEEENLSGTYVLRYYLTNPIRIVATYLSDANFFLWTKHTSINALNEFENVAFNLFPNPSNNLITVRINNESEDLLTIFGPDGRIVKILELTTMEQTFDISELSAGWYTVSNGTSTVTFQKIF